MKVSRFPSFLFLLFFLLLAAIPVSAQPGGTGRIFVLMVWDGLRPDSMNERDTPNLFAMAREGVRFDRHHAVYPTLTMVNAASLATGAPPGITGLFGDEVYFAPSLKIVPAGDSPAWIDRPENTEDSKRLAAINAPQAFAGRLLGLDSIAQEVEREGGYIAIIGKQGPTFLFDDRVASITDGRDSLYQPHKDYMFVADDMTAPAPDAKELDSALPAATATGVSDRERDRYFAQLVADKALPAAKKMADSGHPALIVLWQHNPDLTQHRAGLGTVQSLQALFESDQNLGRVRATISALGLADRTDLMVVSDHGFATIQMRVALAPMLAAAGLKESLDSTDVVVAPNGGSDLVYISRTGFPSVESRHAILQKIVDFAEAQEWCGPIFSQMSALGELRGRNTKPYLGWIEGTFSQPAFGLYNASRSPDLIVSFREAPELSNQRMTGPGNPAFAIDATGQQSVPNRSQELVRPVKGAIFADLGSNEQYTTGMGMHGSAGAREIHNFCAAAGPDFRRGLVDRSPSGNTDVAPTITRILGLQPNIGAKGAYPTGRALTEALAGERGGAGATHTLSMTSHLELRGVEVITTLKLARVGDHTYLEDSAVVRKPLGSSP